MMRITDRVKITMTEKVTINDVTKSVVQWINTNPTILASYLHKNPGFKLNAHGELTLKKKLNENKGENTKRSPRRSL